MTVRLFVSSEALTIIRLDIEGVYTCLARNIVGNDSIEYNLCELMRKHTWCFFFAMVDLADRSLVYCLEYARDHYVIC